MKRNFYRIFLSVFLLIFSFSGFGQGNFNWTNLGPDNLGSITRAMAVDGQGNILVGSQGGGLWRSSNKGTSWERVIAYDEIGANPNISSIAVDGNTIYVATGATASVLSYYVTSLSFNSNYDFRVDPEGFKGYLKGLPGGGVYISTDGGSSWEAAPATNTADTRNYQGPFVMINKVYVAGSKVFVATAEGLYYGDKDLENLTKCTGSDAFEGSLVFDIEASGNGNIFAGTTNPASGISDSLYMSTDGGVSFEAVGDEVLFSNGRFSFNGARIAVSPSDPNIVYVAGTGSSQGVNGIFRSDDNGNSWRIYGPVGGPGFRPLNRTGRDAFIFEVFPDDPSELVLAGNSWYTFSEGRGWTQTAQHTNPSSNTYIARNMYSLLFSDANTLFIGTDQQIIRSDDRGLTFTQQSKGYETGLTYSVASIGLESQPSVIAGTPHIGTIYNRNFDSESAGKQGFGRILTFNNGEVAASSLHPGAILAQGSDRGTMRSLNFGEAFERFYGQPLSPQVAGLNPAGSDTIIDRPNASSGGGSLFNSGGAAQAPFVLNELIPESLLDRNDLSQEDLIDQSEEYLFFCSRNYVWVANGIFGDGLQVKWNRISNELAGGTDYFTSIAVASNDDHTLFVGSSQGGLWRLDRPHDLANYDASVNVVDIGGQASSGLASMNGRWLSAIAVDPKNPERVVVAYAGYGGGVSAVQSFLFMTETAISNPVFVPLLDNGSASRTEPVYSLKFVEDPNGGESALLVGSESGLFSVDTFTIIPGAPFIRADFTNEFGNSFGRVPVYDIEVRKYTSRYLDPEVQEFLNITKDNRVFVATHGRGIWSTEDLVFGRKGNPGEEPVELDPFSVRLFPNPSEGSETYMQVVLPEEGILAWEIVDVSGKVVSSQKAKNYAGGKQLINLNTSAYAPGVYMIRLTAETEGKLSNSVLKLIKM